jgi:hypothetical protein
LRVFARQNSSSEFSANESPSRVDFAGIFGS